MPSYNKMLQGPGKPMPHLGDMIRHELELRRLTPTEVARHLNLSITGLLSSIRQPTLHAAILWRAGIALQHNFFAALALEHPVPMPPTAREKELEQQLAAAQQQITDLQKENQVYQKVLSSMNIKL